MREAIRAPDVIGTFGCPDVEGPFPAVLALGGSAGGIPEGLLDMLSSAGLASLGLAYFAGPTAPDLTHEGLPADLVEIPLERIERGLRWLIQHRDVSTQDGRVGIIGVSKGGELALLVAATFPELVGPVVAYTPSSVVWQGVAWSAVAGQQAPPARSSWTFRGEPLAFVPYPAGVAGTASARGLAILPIYDKGLDQTQAAEQAAIPIERATGPLLVISGSDDQMWPAERMCRIAVERMRRFGRIDDITHLNYPDAGHRLFPWVPAPDDAPGLPVAFDLGGSLAAATAADADARPRIIAHLRRNL